MFQTNKVQGVVDAMAGALRKRQVFKFLFKRIKLFTINVCIMLTLCIFNFLEM